MRLQFCQLIAVRAMHGDPAPLGDKADDLVARDWLAAAGNMVHQVAYPFHHYPAIVLGAILRRVGFLLQLLQRGRILLGGARFIELRLQEVDHLVETDIATADGGQQFIELVEVIARQQVLFRILQADAQMLQLVVEDQGKVLRNHGRAKVIHQRSQDSGDPFHMRLKSHYAHKADIAREALAWIDEGMVIALDASSTCWYLARQLPDRPLHVFTNSQPICQELAKRDQITLTCSGGTLQRKYGCYVNPALISQLKSLEIDLFIFSCEGIDPQGALWDSNAFNADFKSILLKRAAQSLLLIDKSKFNRSGEARIGHLDDVTHIVSDAPQP